MNATDIKVPVPAPEVRVLNAILEMVGKPEQYKQQLADFAKARADAEAIAAQAAERLATATTAEKVNRDRDEQLIARETAVRAQESQLWQRQQEHRRLEEATSDLATKIEAQAKAVAQDRQAIEAARTQAQQALDERQAELDKREKDLAMRSAALDQGVEMLATRIKEHDERVAALRKLIG